MSVTVTVANNENYCVENNLVGYTEYGCQTCEFDGNKPDCRECGGSGKVRFDDFPFEMNIANGNFSRVWQALDLPVEFGGHLDAKTLLAKVAACDVSKIVRDPRSEQSGNVRVHYCGISHEHAQSYLSRLEDIAREADRRGKEVVWG